MTSEEPPARAKGRAGATGKGGNTTGVAAAEEPEDVLAIKNALKAMGVAEYEPGVMQLLMNYMYRCAADVVHDAEKYVHLAGQDRVTYDDVMLAVQSMQVQLQGQIPTPDDLLGLARQKNIKPLPKPLAEVTMSLPVSEKTQTTLQQNYRVVGTEPAGGKS